VNLGVGGHHRPSWRHRRKPSLPPPPGPKAVPLQTPQGHCALALARWKTTDSLRGSQGHRGQGVGGSARGKEQRAARLDIKLGKRTCCVEMAFQRVLANPIGRDQSKTDLRLRCPRLLSGVWANERESWAGPLPNAREWPQRCIDPALYAMYELGLTSDRPYRENAAPGGG